MTILASGLLDTVGDGEDLARFLTQSNQFTANGVKQAAFLPSPSDRETSVFRHGCEPRDSLWAIGRGAAGDRTLYGAGIVKTSDVRGAHLDVIADEPPLRHAVIRGWPWLDDNDLQKAQQKERALILASKSTLLRCGA